MSPYTRTQTLQLPQDEARVFGERIEKRRQATDCAKRTDRCDDIDGLRNATPIQT
jgi:hypothetical protein